MQTVNSKWERANQVQRIFNGVVEKHDEVVQRLRNDSEEGVDVFDSTPISAEDAQILDDVQAKIIAEHYRKLGKLGLL